MTAFDLGVPLSRVDGSLHHAFSSVSLNGAISATQEHQKNILAAVAQPLSIEDEKV